MAPEARTGERYANQVGELWSGLAETLVRLEALAAAPEQLEDDEVVDGLRRLQYRLHAASEHVFGLAPPAGAEPAHTELAAALAGARDATGEIVEAVEMAGLEAVETIVHEWRGALFRVRLARLRLAAPPTRRAARGRTAPHQAAARCFVLALGRRVAFAVGATTGPWPVWVAGMLAVCGRSSSLPAVTSARRGSPFEMPQRLRSRARPGPDEPGLPRPTLQFGSGWRGFSAPRPAAAPKPLPPRRPRYGRRGEPRERLAPCRAARGSRRARARPSSR